MKISVAVITFNEEEMIESCLKSVDWADERIVLDSGSTDKTLNIAQKLGAKVYAVKFINFSQIRKLAREKATGNWILYIDADERVTPDLAQEIKEKIKNTKYSAFNIKRKNCYLGEPWPYEETVVRFFKKENLPAGPASYTNLLISKERLAVCPIIFCIIPIEV
jgi:glycosyltransferase involved in cell wall biosynthesis